MTTLKDINIIREAHERAAERYNRRCRRLVALYTAGRKVDDHVILLRTDERVKRGRVFYGWSRHMAKRKGWLRRG